MISAHPRPRTAPRTTSLLRHAIGDRRPWISMLLAATALVAIAAPAQAGNFAQGPRLLGTGAAGSARQGASVAFSSDGNTAIVGGYADSSNTGAVWVFTRSAGVWTQQGAKLVGIAAAGAALQGYSIALSSDGNTAIVGGPLDNSNAGAAWVFTRGGGLWTQQGAKLVGAGAVGGADRGRLRGQLGYRGRVGVHAERWRLDAAGRQAGRDRLGRNRAAGLCSLSLFGRQHGARRRAGRRHECGRSVGVHAKRRSLVAARRQARRSGRRRKRTAGLCGRDLCGRHHGDRRRACR